LPLTHLLQVEVNVQQITPNFKDVNVILYLYALVGQWLMC